MFESPVRVLSQSQVQQMNLEFYNSDIHRASFALPQFVKKVCYKEKCCFYLNVCVLRTAGATARLLMTMNFVCLS